MITVIEQSTTERQEETEKLFQEIKPYLDEGFGFHTSLEKIGRINKNTRLNRKNGWFRDLVEYGESQGYTYGNHIYHHANRVGRVKQLAWDHLW